MTKEIEIRVSLPSDARGIEEFYPRAFPDEDLLPLLRDLLSEGENVLSLVAVRDETPVGHAVFTLCGLAGGSERVALLGPLAVAPKVQRQGIGGGLVRDGLERLKAEGVPRVQVLGDPAYYGRFGFKPDDGVAPPYPLPKEWRSAWQSLSLGDGSPALQGTLSVPPPWQHPALWSS